MTKPRDWFLMPEPFKVVFEQPTWIHLSGQPFRIAECRPCGQGVGVDYGVRFVGYSHWCSRGENTLVIWSAA